MFSTIEDMQPFGTHHKKNCFFGTACRTSQISLYCFGGKKINLAEYHESNNTYTKCP